MIEKMQTPKTRAEFEHRLHILRELIIQGKYHVASGLTLGFDQIRLLPNGRIDFLSVNESARLQANMTTQFLNDKITNIINTDKSPNSTPKAGPDNSENKPK
jgi:hypothetical protein